MLTPIALYGLLTTCSTLALAYLLWAEKRKKVSPEILKLERAVRNLETQRRMIIHVETIDPDDVFLRSRQAR